MEISCVNNSASSTSLKKPESWRKRTFFLNASSCDVTFDVRCHTLMSQCFFFFFFSSKVGVTTIFFWLWWAELNHFADRLWPPGHMFDTLGLDSSSPWLFLCFLHLLILSVLSCLFHALHNLQLIASFPKTHTRAHTLSNTHSPY